MLNVLDITAVNIVCYIKADGKDKDIGKNYNSKSFLHET
jgi:hypothetical protein